MPTLDPTVVLGEGLLRLLRALGGSAGCLLVLEDLHWADADSVALVEYVAGAAVTWPVLIAASARAFPAWTRPRSARLPGTAPVVVLCRMRYRHSYTRNQRALLRWSLARSRQA